MKAILQITKIIIPVPVKIISILMFMITVAVNQLMTGVI